MESLEFPLWLRFRETSGTTAFNSGTLGATQDATLTDVTLGATDSMGANEAGTWNATTSNASVPNGSFINAAQRTIAAFVNQAGAHEAGGRLYAIGNDLSRIFINPSGATTTIQVVFRAATTNATSQIVLPFGTGTPFWLFATYDNAGDRKIRIYYATFSTGLITENTYSTQDAAVGTLTNETDTLYIGNQSTASRTFNGTIGEFIYGDSVLTLTQMQEIITRSRALAELSTPLLPGAWTWYNDPRVLALSDRVVVGAVQSDGTVVAADYRLTDELMMGPHTLRAAMQVDDHINPAFLRRASDNKIMTWYAFHLGPTIYQRVSNAADNVDGWAAESTLDASLGLETYSYANPVQLTDETNDPIYLFTRGDPVGGVGWGLYYSKSEDNGATWAAATRFIDNGSERPYLKLAQNGNARIDLAFTDGHPDVVSTNSIYHGYYEGGNLYQSDGTLVGAIGSGPYTPSQFTKVYDGATDHAWIHDIKIDGSGNPVLVYAIFPTTTDHRYRYAKWNGSAWSDNQICTAGTYLYSGQPHYSGGVYINPDDVNTVYASRDTGDGVHQIWRCVTADGGANWTLTKLTSGSDKAFRPVAAGGKVFYVTGRYTSFIDYDTHIGVLDA